VIIGAPADVVAARALWAALGGAIRALAPSDQLQLSRLISSGHDYDRLPGWARDLVVRVALAVVGGGP
jgi:hypothetical protein